MGSTFGRLDERPLHEEFVSSFYIDECEVSKSEFGLFKSVQENPEQSLRQHPVTEVNWFEASQYCASRGGRLPTESEWEWAALFQSNPATALNTAMPDVWPETAAPNRNGSLEHMLGNVWEWTSSDFGPYGEAPLEGNGKVLKGGSFRCDKNTCYGFRPQARLAMPPETQADHIGFRCVYDAPTDTSLSQSAPPRPNIFLVILDDMRPELGCYGSQLAQTPNLDAFSSNSFVFEQAIVGVPVCGGSRASLFSGLRPTFERFNSYDSRIDEDAPEAVHLHCLLRESGYVTGSNGKILHHPYDGETCWSRPVWKPARAPYLDLIMPESRMMGDSLGWGPAFERAPNDAVYMDQRTLSKTIQDLRELAARPDTAPPFFLGMGIFKPHLPFTAHEMFWDLYDKETIGLAENRFPPQDAPWQALHNFGELRMYGNIPNEGPLPDSLQLELRHGYLAALSFADAVFGRAMEELETLGLDENTVVVVMGDHGWQLGEHSLWAKHANFQTSLRTPLIIRLPGATSGGRVSTLVETVDLFPTLCALAGVSPPEGTAGVDLMPLLVENGFHEERAAYSLFKHAETITTGSHSYTEFSNPSTGEIEATMLFDLLKDPDENANVSDLPDYAQIKAMLQISLDSLRSTVH